MRIRFRVGLGLGLAVLLASSVETTRAAHNTLTKKEIAEGWILLYDGGPTIVSIFTSQNRGDFVRLEETLGRIALDLVEAWR